MVLNGKPFWGEGVYKQQKFISQTSGDWKVQEPGAGRFGI